MNEDQNERRIGYDTQASYKPLGRGKVPKWVRRAAQNLPLNDHPSWDEKYPYRITVHEYVTGDSEIQMLIEWTQERKIKVAFHGSSYNRDCFAIAYDFPDKLIDHYKKPSKNK